MKNTSLALSLLIAASGILGGCATITKDANQSVQIETYDKNNQPISGVKCTAENERGKWTTLTPGFVSVHRSSQNLMVNCERKMKQRAEVQLFHASTAVCSAISSLAEELGQS